MSQKIELSVRSFYKTDEGLQISPSASFLVTRGYTIMQDDLEKMVAGLEETALDALRHVDGATGFRPMTHGEVVQYRADEELPDA